MRGYIIFNPTGFPIASFDDLNAAENACGKLNEDHVEQTKRDNEIRKALCAKHGVPFVPSAFTVANREHLIQFLNK